MVARRTLTALLLTLLACLHLQAQSYSTDDTLSEYPNHGTFYHDRFEGRKTASGEVFDQNKFTAAHWKIKLGTYVLVTNQNNGKQVIVRVNDRCPKRGVFDLSHRAANAIGIRGCQPVTVRILPPGYEQRWAAQETLFDSVRSRLSPSAPPPSAPPVPRAKAPTQHTSVAQVPPPPPSNPHATGDRYTLFLGEAASHGEAYKMISALPTAYQDHVVIEQPLPDDSLNVSLDLDLSRRQADELRRSLHATFPQARVVPMLTSDD